MIGSAGRIDAGAFLARLLRLDPTAVVRMRPADGDQAQAWAMLPFGVLATRSFAADIPGDLTVGAADLLGALDRGDTRLPPRRDQAWRWPLPSGPGQVIEKLPADEVIRVAAAAARTLHAAVTTGVRGRPVGERVVREALLDHVPIVATSAGGERISVPQRLVQGLMRMGFLPARHSSDAVDPEVLVTVLRSGSWTGLRAAYGAVWHRPASSLRLR